MHEQSSAVRQRFDSAFWRLVLLVSLPLLLSCGDSNETRSPEPEPNPVPEPEPEPEDFGTDTVYIVPSAQPNAAIYLPAPPAETDADFIDDKLQYEWGKSQRNTSRGEEAHRTMGHTIDPVRSIMARVLKIDTICPSVTPHLSRLLTRAFWTGYQSAAFVKRQYARKRPFVFMDEEPWYSPDTQDATGSFVSATTAGAWATALIFAEMWPPLQDAILRRGVRFGQDRVISGTNFQSDINGAFLSGAAAVACAHNSTRFHRDIEVAREEYKQLLGESTSFDPLSEALLPEGVRFLDPPVMSDSYRYEADLARYEYAKTFRTTIRGMQAVLDADPTEEYMAHIFGSTMNISISESATPAIFELISMLYPWSIELANQVKYTYYRPRPFVELNDPTPLPDHERSERESSSFPSGHTCISWSMALLLTEVAPECQNAILKRAYDFGYNRQIVGFHWATDIEAGRILACALVVYLHARKDFRTQLALAREEYLKAAQK